MESLPEGAFGWSSETWIALGTLALAGATFLVIVVALFEEPLRRYFTRAKLSMFIGKESPDTHQIALTHPQSGAFIGWAIYVRIRVRHRGGSPAENAEIIASDLWRLDGGRRIPVPTFLPMSLKWSHFQPSTITTRIPRNGFRHCDLGALLPSDLFGYSPPVSGEPRFRLDTMVQPNPVAGGEIPNVLSPGRYEIELRLTGDNVRTVAERWIIVFEAAWSDDAQTMIDRLHIEKAK